MVEAGYRCIFNTETKRYNPRLIGKLHVAVSLFDTNRGKTPNRAPRQSLWLHSSRGIETPPLPRPNSFAFTPFSATFDDPRAITFSARNETNGTTELCPIFYTSFDTVLDTVFNSIDRCEIGACAKFLVSSSLSCMYRLNILDFRKYRKKLGICEKGRGKDRKETRRRRGPFE